MRRLPALCFVLLPLVACAEHRVAGPPLSESTMGPRGGAPGAGIEQEPEGAAGTIFPGLDASLDVGAAMGAGIALLAGGSDGLPAGGFVNNAARRRDPPWIEAVRLERWADAATEIDALPEADRARPEMRYVRARAAIGQGDGARAVPLLDGIDQALPLLASDIARQRAEAKFLAGPYAEAAAYFEKSQKARDLTHAAEAYEKASDAKSARRMIDRAIAAAQRDKSVRDEAEARMVRARLSKAASGDAAAEADLRWVAVHAPSSERGRAAATALDRMKRPLSSKERMQTISGLVEAGSSDALVEIERVRKDAAAPKEELTHARAMALYKARDYAEAAKAFKAASAAPGKSGHEAEDLFYAARSLARANRDGEAITAYLDVIARYKKSVHAERAQYLAARLYLQNGRFKEAAKAYETYLATYKKAESRDDAAYERALAELSSGAPASARKSLGELARRARGEEAQKLRELEGVAALRDGDRAAAITLWSEIARGAPLSWAAQMSRARLVSVGAPLPPLIEPGASAPPSALDLRLPPATALLASLGLDGDAESRLAASEGEATAAYGGRKGEALCGLYGMLSRAKRRYRVGINAVSLAALFRAPSEVDRWAWDCLYPQPFAGGVRALEDQYSLPRGLIHALMRQESAFDPVIVSPASAVGLMQLMPGTARQAAGELSMRFEPAHLTIPDMNLRLGAFYVSKLLKMFRGNIVLSAAAYNAGPRAVSHWLEVGADNDLDLWVARIPYDETRNYVARVAQNLSRYQWLMGGEAAVTPLSIMIPSEARASSDAY